MEKNLSGLKYILAGISLMIIASAALDLSSLFMRNNLVNWADILVHAIGWIMVIPGVLKCMKSRREFKMALLASFAGIAATAGQGLLAFMEIRSGLGDIAFIDMKVMFMEYIGLLAMLYVLYMVMIAVAQLLAKNGLIKRTSRVKKKAYISVLIVLGTCMLTPFAYVFPTAVKLILACVSTALGVAAQFYMANYINKGYKKLI